MAGLNQSTGLIFKAVAQAYRRTVTNYKYHITRCDSIYASGYAAPSNREAGKAKGRTGLWLPSPSYPIAPSTAPIRRGNKENMSSVTCRYCSLATEKALGPFLVRGASKMGIIYRPHSRGRFEHGGLVGAQHAGWESGWRLGAYPSSGVEEAARCELMPGVTPVPNIHEHAWIVEAH